MGGFLSELAHLALAELNHDIGQVRALCEDRRRAIEDLLQDREVLQGRITELERFIETEEQP